MDNSFKKDRANDELRKSFFNLGVDIAMQQCTCREDSHYMCVRCTLMRKFIKYRDTVRREEQECPQE